MKHLFNYCPVDFYERELKERDITIKSLIDKLGLDGIEQFVYTKQPDYKEITVGVHLNYWPYWMDFWLKKAKRLQQQFRTVRERQTYFRDAMSRDEWLSVIRMNICDSLTQKPEYLVWHVAEADNETIFSFDFHYDDRQVLAEAANVFNAVADEIPTNVAVLFENLWWPGLRLTDVRKVKYFFSLIERENVGIMLDTGHLMNTNTHLRSEQEGADYICRTIDKLGEYAQLIKGVHLNCSLSGKYQCSFGNKVPEVINNEVIWRHIAAIDQHRPFTTRAAKQILDCVQPTYVNHELAYDDLRQMEEWVAQQLACSR